MYTQAQTVHYKYVVDIARVLCGCEGVRKNHQILVCIHIIYSQMYIYIYIYMVYGVLIKRLVKYS